MPSSSAMPTADCDVYVYGMTVLSTIHRLKGAYPAPDAYQEIEQTVVMPGGEAANCAIVLSSLGLNARLDGCCLGELTAEPLLEYLGRHRVDCSRLQRLGDFPGWRDMVLCDGASRTVFGWFVQYLFGGDKLWTRPCEASIREARCVALDPFFGAESAEVAEMCAHHGKDYVTIDCKYTDPIAQRARAVVISREFSDREYPNIDADALFEEYRRTCSGLVIFTAGAGRIVYSHASGPRKMCAPLAVDVVDTLGAGDTFRAGIVYGLLQRWPDERLMRFAAACAAVACTRFPSIHEPPTMAEVTALLSSGC